MNKISDDPVIILTITCMQEGCNSISLKCGRFNMHYSRMKRTQNRKKNILYESLDGSFGI